MDVNVAAGEVVADYGVLGSNVTMEGVGRDAAQRQAARAEALPDESRRQRAEVRQARNDSRRGRAGALIIRVSRRRTRHSAGVARKMFEPFYRLELAQPRHRRRRARPVDRARRRAGARRHAHAAESTRGRTDGRAAPAAQMTQNPLTAARGGSPPRTSSRLPRAGAVPNRCGCRGTRK